MRTPLGDLAAQSDDGIADPGLRIWQPSASRTLFNVAPSITEPGKIARAGVDRPDRIVEVEGRVRARQAQVGFVERADRPDIFPVAIEIEPIHRVATDGVGDDLRRRSPRTIEFSSRSTSTSVLKR